ncbi:MAG TPA: hypothetical protein VLA28_07560, partial [Afifellaceae bacterium]|nr:hypothetical protein [Afifellaceae bacterium]
MRERRAPRILILDPALRSRAGHHFNAVKRLQSAVAALGGRAETLCWRIADSEILRELDARAAFEE